MSAAGRRLRFGCSSAAVMIRNTSLGCALLLALGVLLAASANGQQPQQAKEAAAGERPAAEPRALDLLKASSGRLAAARTMRFTAVVSHENPSRPGPPLIYTTRYEVTLQRPDKLRVITPGDGPVSEFYYDGKTMTALAPAENLVAVAPAPPTVEAAMEAAYRTAAIYFPFTDLIVTDPYRHIADGLELAFYIGQSRVIGGTTTDMVAYSTHGVFVQMWIGAEDKLPRMARAVYRSDPAQLRHQIEFSDWQLDGAVPADVFASSRAASATRIPFAHPGAQPPPGVGPPAQGQPPKAQ